MSFVSHVSDAVDTGDFEITTGSVFPESSRNRYDDFKNFPGDCSKPSLKRVL